MISRGPTSSNSSDAPLWIGCVLAIAVVAVFGQTLRHDFLFYDDPLYITGNPMVAQGVTIEGLRWSLTAVVGSIWLPLTMISHMLDVQLFGMRPGLHHFVNVLIHAANVALAFAALRRLTGDLWKSAMVAALFALHPLRAESVAWAAERKDVLSAFFFFAGLWAYARYARSGQIADYLLVFLSLALGLCAKPMLVTFPFVLLLLDYWPLLRTGVHSGPDTRVPFLKLMAEKIPLFALSIAAGAISIWSQSSTGATGSLETYPPFVRIGNAVLSVAIYLRQTIAPYGLAAIYTHPGSDISWGAVALSGLVVIGITMAALFTWHRQPYALIGWLWFAGMLVPVLGLIQVGNASHADRYTYLPHVGLFVALVWTIGGVVGNSAGRKRLAAIGSGAVLSALAVTTYLQVRHWQNQVTLFEHTVEVSPDHAQAQFNLGAGYALVGRPDLAEKPLRESLRLNPRGMGTKLNLAGALIEIGRPAEAQELLEELIDEDPYRIEYQYMLAGALYKQGKYPEALFRAKEALRIDPAYKNALDLAEKCRTALPPQLPIK